MIFVFSLLLFSCQNDASNHKKEHWHSGLEGYNFTDKEISDFYVGDKKIPFAMSPLGGGSGSLCCAKLPKPWYSGATLHIKWTNAEVIKGQGGETIWKEKDVPLPEYGDSFGTLSIIFLKNDEVVLDVTGNLKEILEKYRKPRPKGWVLPSGHQRYCEGIKLTNETPQQCFERLILKDKENQDPNLEYDVLKWVDNPQINQ